MATLAVIVALVIIGLGAASIGRREGPHSSAFVAVAVTIWTLADLATTFLLLARFYISGKISLAIVAAGYGMSGLLSIPYLLLFPGVFWPATMPARLAQIAPGLWLLWHVTFPLAIIVALVVQARTRLTDAIVDRRMRVIGIVAGAIPLAAGMLTIAMIAAGERLAIIDVHGRFLHSDLVSPIVGGINLLACTVLVGNWKRISRLRLCLLIALTAGLLDVLLNTNSVGRYAVQWYCGKVETLLSATVVLAMMLADLVRMFGSVAEMANRDSLTGLFNRRAFDERLALIFALGQRQSGSVATLLIDVDLFKAFNDRFGHSAGDAVLARVADVIKAVARRPLDIAARWGGEEFVIVLRGTSYAGTRLIAQDVRRAIEQTPYVTADGQTAPISVSIGVCFAEDAAGTDARSAFAIADRALYRAKQAGRNRVVIEVAAGAEAKRMVAGEIKIAGPVPHR